MYNYINKVCLGNDFTSIAQDMQSVMKYLAPPMEMYTPIMAEYMSGAPMPYLYDNMSSIFNAPNLYPKYQIQFHLCLFNRIQHLTRMKKRER